MAEHEVDVKAIAEYIQANTDYKPKIGVVCGSGLSGLCDALEEPKIFKYAEIPSFPETTVPGHKAELAFGKLRGVVVVCMRGRFHCYEGNHPKSVAVGVRLFKLLGCDAVMVTNAAGGLNDTYSVGDVMVIGDHVNMPGLAGCSPLVGPNEEMYGTRFPAMSDAYDRNLQQLALQCADDLDFKFVRPNGTYAHVYGPSYETGAECAMLRSFGCDSVGMSTVMEVVAARHAGLRVVGLSLITNMVVYPGSNAQVATHQEVLDAVVVRQPQMQALVEEIVFRYGNGDDGAAGIAKAKAELQRKKTIASYVIAGAVALAGVLAIAKRV